MPLPYNVPGSQSTTTASTSVPTHSIPKPTCNTVQRAQDTGVPITHESSNVLYQIPGKEDKMFYKMGWSSMYNTKTYYSGAGFPGTLKCNACNPEANIIRPTAGTNTKRINPVVLDVASNGFPSSTKTDIPGYPVYTTTPYSFDTKAYLRSKQKSFQTNQTGRPIPGVAYGRETENCCIVPVPPSNDVEHSSGTRISLYSTKLNRNHASQDPESREVRTKCCKLTYKPSNAKFSHQGAVSSSARLAGLKYNTLRTSKNTSNFPTAWTLQAANAGVYRLNGIGAYYVKNKPFICRPSDYTLLDGSLTRPGSKLKCSR